VAFFWLLFSGRAIFSLSGISKLHHDLDQMEQSTLVQIELVGDIKAAWRKSGPRLAG
jgi:hypothetical protein